MLLKISDLVSECLRRAEECRRLARIAVNATLIERFLKLEERWLRLAQSRQFIERGARFLGSERRAAYSEANEPIRPFLKERPFV